MAQEFSDGVFKFDAFSSIQIAHPSAQLHFVAHDPARPQIVNMAKSADAAPGEIESPSAKRSKTPALDQFGIDFTARARLGELDPVIGRSEEIEACVRVLARRTKNNPILLGEAGVGKTAIVEGLAQVIASGSCPECLASKRIVALDLSAMVAGTKYRGQFEERIKAVMKEVKDSKNVILFIDEIHTMVGAGGSEGGMDASNILKPALSRGEVTCIGATTTDEYRKYFEHDAALARRFQPVKVEPPSVDDAIMILRGLREKYEAFHKVRYDDDALVQAAKLSARYITDRHLPDKAIDLLDEAGAVAKIRMAKRPEGIQILTDRINEANRLRREAALKEDFNTATFHNEASKELTKERDLLTAQWQAKLSDELSRVTVDDVLGILARKTGVPVTKLSKKESEEFLGLEARLKARVIGQDEACEKVSRAMKRARVGLGDPKRPVGSFLFVGPTGVGKTLMTKALAAEVFLNEDAVVTLDMSEYMESHSVARLIGSPPGYVGYDDGGQLTEKIRRRPHSIVLFDEIEKAHPKVLDMLLQILEEGRLTDGQGRSVDFRNTVVVMTSNIGVQAANRPVFGLQSRRNSEESEHKQMVNTIEEEVRRNLRPEFINRIDNMVVFHKLTPQNLTAIVDIELIKLQRRLKEAGNEVEFTDAAKQFLVEKGTDPSYGARPLRRAVTAYLEDYLAEEKLSGRIADGVKIVIDREPGAERLVFRPAVSQAA